jgi:RNA polymerase sigma-70 factor (ECF subfamily)
MREIGQSESVFLFEHIALSSFSSGTMNDRERISGTRAGNIDDFHALVGTYQNRVINICYGFLKNKEDAEDIAQEVFIEVYQSISAFREEAKLSTWIYRISVRKALDFIRKKNRKKRRLPIQKSQRFQSERLNISTAKDNGPEKRLINLERAQILKQAVDSLPENQRIAITLNKYEGFSGREIAEIMGINLSAVEALLFRAKNNLQKKLRRYFEKNL